MKEQGELTLLIDVIHKISQDITSSNTEQEVFDSLANNVATQLGFVDCNIFKVNNKNKTLRQIATCGSSKMNETRIVDALELKMGQGHAGIVAQEGKSFLSNDVSQSNDRYFVSQSNDRYFHLTPIGSELAVPIKIDDQVYAVVTSEHPKKNFYNKNHQKILEVITSIAESSLMKIREVDELRLLKEKSDNELKRKSADLDIAMGTLSEQYITLKNQSEKQETLTQEVHHRVNNNLQVISSIVRLYINQETPESLPVLKEIHNRIQAMALIYQNIYKSIENSVVDVNSYLNDLINYLKNTSSSVKIAAKVKTEFDYFDIDVLVPLGLFITEVYFYWISQSPDKSDMEWNVSVEEWKEDFTFILKIEDNQSCPFKEKLNLSEGDFVSTMLTAALVDQLNGEVQQGFDEGNFILLKFKN